MYSKILTFCLLGILIFGWFGYRHMNSKLEKANKSNAELTMKADLAIGRANTVFADPNKKDLSTDIQKDITTRDASIDSIGHIQTKYISVGEGELTTSPLVISKCTVLSTPFAFHDFRLDASGDATKKTFRYTLTQKFEVTTAETRLSNGAVNNYAELYELDASGKRVGKMEITKFDVVHAPLSLKRFRFWDPYLDLSFGGQLFANMEPSMFGNVGLSIMSWGRDKDLDFRFVRLAVGIDQQGIQFSLAPVQYNFARPIPLINNLWAFPNIGYNIDYKQYFLGLGIAATL